MGDIQIIYRAGKDNALADALSRNPQGPPPEDGIAEGESQVAVINEDGIAEGDSPVSKQLIELLRCIKDWDLQLLLNLQIISPAHTVAMVPPTRSLLQRTTPFSFCSNSASLEK